MQFPSASNETHIPVRAARSALSVLALRRMASRWRGVLVVLFFMAVGLVAASPARGQGVNREYQLKAAYLYKFATYVEWPEEAFRDSTSPFVIGVLGPDPVGPQLKKIAKVKKIDGRKIDVRNYKRAEDVRDCHILFISRALKNDARQASVKALSGRNILLVGEIPDFVKQGGAINFAIQENRIRIHISKSAYEREKLKISAQLLRIATVVR